MAAVATCAAVKPIHTAAALCAGRNSSPYTLRSEEHTSELQSRQYLVCRLLLEKKKNVRRPDPVPRVHARKRRGRHHRASREERPKACEDVVAEASSGIEHGSCRTHQAEQY